MAKIRVTIWNEFMHEQVEGETGDYIRGIYPKGIHEALKQNLAADDLDITAVTLDIWTDLLDRSLDLEFHDLVVSQFFDFFFHENTSRYSLQRCFGKIHLSDYNSDV